MDQIDREIAELDARIAEFRATPHTKAPAVNLEPPAKRLTVTLSRDIARALDQYRRNYDGPMPSESEAIRELVWIALLHLSNKSKREAKP